MRHTIALSFILAALVGCTTFNPTTGQKEYDPVKTHKVRATIKPAVATLVTAAIQDNPTTRPAFARIANHVCSMRDGGEVSLTKLKEAVNAELAPYTSDNLVLAGSINTLFALIEINFADRLRADLPEDEFTWSLLDVLCESIMQAVVQTVPAVTPPTPPE